MRNVDIVYDKRLIAYCRKMDKLIFIGQFVHFFTFLNKCRGPPVAQIYKFELIGGYFFE